MNSLTVVKTSAGDGASVAVVTLNDPDRRNILSSGISDAMVEAFDDFESSSSDVGAVVITGAGSAFCAGADLSALGAHGAADEASRKRGLQKIYQGFLRVARSTLPTVAAVNGPAVGAGFNLALGCDVRIAGSSARFDTRFLQLGIHPGGGHMWMLTRAIGPQAAAAMVLFNEVLDAQAAVRRGLAFEVVEKENLLEHAIAFAARAASNPRELTRQAKLELMLAPDEHDEAVNREIEAQMRSMTQPFFIDRLRRLQRTITTGK